jgi:probable rRNA maturation factor
MPVYITTLGEVSFEDIDLKEVENFANLLLEALGKPNLELSVAFTDDRNIHELNKQWRNKDKPTDVLSFPQDFPSREFDPKLSPKEELEKVLKECSNCNLLGDIVISLDTARRQAKTYGWSPTEEVKRLLLHGIVHLLGFDHETSAQDEEKFKAIENLLLEQVKNIPKEGS